ncbi:MAG: DUF3307 domain-containing protein [Patescibacteria group bacterium]|nr:DUF3307 domain-containing protein [Patescibacteria group bacterium]
MISIFILLQTKHLIADWIIQPRWMHQNKGKVGHPGGIAHAAFHAILTASVLIFFASGELTLIIAAAEFVAHYLIDWAKMNANKKRVFVI